MPPIKGQRIEGDDSKPEYSMGKQALVQACFADDITARNAARYELARREWNKLVKKGQV